MLRRVRFLSFSAPLFLGGAIAHPPAAPPEVTFTITSVEPQRPVEFEVQVLAADLRPGIHLDRAKAPYTLRVPGREAYAVFHQVAGTGLMRVEVKPATNRTVISESRTILFVVRGDSAGATISRW